MSDLMMGKVVVITGGASGIGRATALAFAREGAKVVIGDVDVKGAQETIEAIRSNGGTGISMCVDVTKAADVQHMISGGRRWVWRLGLRVQQCRLRRVDRWRG